MTARARANARNAFLVLIGAVLGVFALTCAQPQPTESTRGAITQASAAPVTVLPNPAFAASGDVSIADVAQRVVPSVVNISATRVVAAGQSPFLNDPFFREFFGPRLQPPGDRPQTSLGSGVIVSKDGLVLTNNHVVQKAEDIVVTLNGGTDLDAEIVGTDPKSDLALLRLQGDFDVEPLAFGSSSSLRLGDVVLAVGNPFGVGQTVTMGIVSAKGRSTMGIVDYEDFIQTDAAINPGNSGGALVNMRGELVGINTAIVSRSGGSAGVGFAIPTDMARPIMDSLLEHGKVVRGWLGVAIQELDKDLADTLGVPAGAGVVISDVAEDSPAAKAGLERGDVVIALNGAELDDIGTFRNRVAALGPDADAEMIVLRDGKKLKVTAVLGTQEDEPIASADTVPDEGLLSGVTVRALTDDVRAHLQLGDEVEGVVITQVAPGSRAQRAGLVPGDVIVEVDRQKVTSVQAFREAYDPSADKILLLVSRDGATVYVALHE